MHSSLYYESQIRSPVAALGKQVSTHPSREENHRTARKVCSSSLQEWLRPNPAPLLAPFLSVVPYFLLPPSHRAQPSKNDARTVPSWDSNLIEDYLSLLLLKR